MCRPSARSQRAATYQRPAAGQTDLPSSSVRQTFRLDIVRRARQTRRSSGPGAGEERTRCASERGSRCSRWRRLRRRRAGRRRRRQPGRPTSRRRGTGLKGPRSSAGRGATMPRCRGPEFAARRWLDRRRRGRQASTVGARRTAVAVCPSIAAPPGLEPYVTLSSAQRVSDAGCRFPAESVYALRLNHGAVTCMRVSCESGDSGNSHESPCHPCASRIPAHQAGLPEGSSAPGNGGWPDETAPRSQPGRAGPDHAAGHGVRWLAVGRAGCRARVAPCSSWIPSRRACAATVCRTSTSRTTTGATHPTTC